MILMGAVQCTACDFRRWSDECIYFKFAPSAILAQPCVVVCGTKDFFRFAGAPAKRTLSKLLSEMFDALSTSKVWLLWPHHSGMMDEVASNHTRLFPQGLWRQSAPTIEWQTCECHIAVPLMTQQKCLIGLW